MPLEILNSSRTGYLRPRRGLIVPTLSYLNFISALGARDPLCFPESCQIIARFNSSVFALHQITHRHPAVVCAYVEQESL